MMAIRRNFCPSASKLREGDVAAGEVVLSSPTGVLQPRTRSSEDVVAQHQKQNRKPRTPGKCSSRQKGSDSKAVVRKGTDARAPKTSVAAPLAESSIVRKPEKNLSPVIP